ncbi:MAG: DUF3298 domain-containing protein [Lachnospiraceae bacterium]|nr:DUF3298 domain-containing protein [Lachnospiraceae bacterium]
MRKKANWLTILMCSTLWLGGCGMVDDTSTSVVGIPTVTSAPATTATPVPGNVPDVTEEPASPTLTDAPANTQAPAALAAPILSFTTLGQDWYMTDGTTIAMSVTDFTIDVENEGYDALEAALDQLHSGIQRDDYTLLIEEAEEHYNSLDAAGQEYFWGYSSDTNATLTRSDSSVVSLRVYYHDYTGGAHGMFAFCGENFDVETGELLELADILADTEGFYDKAIAYISDELTETYTDDLSPGYQEAVTNAFAPNQTSNWYLTGAGIVITFTPYEVGPYAMGAPEITLPYSEFGSYMHEKYLAPQGEMITYLSANHDYSYLLGETEPIMVEAVTNEWYMLDMRVVAGAVSSELGTFGAFRNGYVIKRADDRSFLVVVCDYMSDDYVTFVYEVTDGALKKCAELPAVYPSNQHVTTEEIEMNMKLDILGSYIATGNYVLGEDGDFLPVSDFYPITAFTPLTIVKELPVTIDGAENTLSPGTQILVTGTNNVDEVHFKVMNSDQTGIIHYTLESPDSWIHLIDGVSEYEYFEDLPYAG